MTLTEFKNWAVKEGSVGKYTDGQFVGECVSLINQYLGRMYGIKAGAWGNAKDWATNKEVAKYFDKVSSPKAGDIGISGATSSNPYGHIWVYLSPTQVLEQNGKVARRVSVNSPLFKPIAILRRKGTTSMAEKVSLEIARIISHGVGGRNGVTNKKNALSGDFDADLNKNHVGQNLDSRFIRKWYNSSEAKKFRSDLAALGKERDSLKAENVKLKAQLKNAGDPTSNDAEVKASLVERAKALLDSLKK